VNVLDAHLFVYRFAHIVNGQCGDGNGGERFHFDASLGGDPGRRGNDDAVWLNGKLNFAMGEGQGMTKRDEFAGFLGGTNSGNASCGQNISLGDFIFANGADSFGLENDFAASDGVAQNDWFCRNVNHAGFTA